jgi:hypothetical protein
MKNLYEIDTDLYIINSSEQINFNDYYITTSNTIAKADIGGSEVANKNKSPKIILTTNKWLIKDGVQAIDDKFLEWFVKNPSCESVEVKHFGTCCGNQSITQCINCEKYNPVYKIIIPQEEPKQEPTNEELLEALKEFRKAPLVFVPAERMYSEEDLKEAFRVGFNVGYNDEESPSYLTFEKWFEQFKKK